MDSGKDGGKQRGWKGENVVRRERGREGGRECGEKGGTKGGREGERDKNE